MSCIPVSWGGHALDTAVDELVEGLRGEADPRGVI